MAKPQSKKKSNWVLKGKEEIVFVHPITFNYAVHSVSWSFIGVGKINKKTQRL